MDKNRYYQYTGRKAQRPIANAKVMGVCAGLAQQFDWDVVVVRIVAVLGLVTFTIPTLCLYLIAGLVFY